jgi:hypothetical protein
MPLSSANAKNSDKASMMGTCTTRKSAILATPEMNAASVKART